MYNTTTEKAKEGQEIEAVAVIGQTFSYVALVFGLFFFLFACKYYIAILIALFFGRASNGKGNGTNGTNGTKSIQNGVLNYIASLRGQNNNGSAYNDGFDNGKKIDEPFISIQLPFYNEKNVARRVIKACSDIDYENYEIIIADDSRDETIEIMKELNLNTDGPTVKFIHRNERSGFKGGALSKATNYMNPKAKYAVVFDADFIPPPDILRRFLWYFEGQDGNGNNGHGETTNGNGHRFADDVLRHYENGQNGKNGGNGNGEELLDRVDDWFERRKIGVVQGYQLHHLNKNENWITKGIRAEFSGGYMIERVAQEFFGSMKMITGSVFMIRAEILKNLGWTHSITEDWDLTIRMYLAGYKVLYTPLIQAPAEIPTTIRALARQRMRWAEGHTFAVKKYFWDVLKSHNMTGREKLEFVYFAPYYLQSFFFLVGTFFWVAAELLGEHPFFWTATFGWCLILSNLFALPLMSLSGLFLEQTAKEDYSGIFSFIVLSYVLTPFQAYAAVKGLLEKDEGGWVRTLKTGSVTDRILQIRVRRLFSWILPRREAPRAQRTEERDRQRRRRPSAMALLFLLLMSTLIVWVTAAAMSVPVDDSPITALNLEYVASGVTINGKYTNMILTHPDYISLGTTRTDSYTLSGTDWQKGWQFYLFGPLEEDYQMKGSLNLHLFLHSDKEHEVDMKVLVTDLDEDGETDSKFSYQFKDVGVDDESPEEALMLPAEVIKSIKFREGHSIIVEILFKGEDGWTFYLDYDSTEKHSRVDFPGMVMPESLLPLLILAPLIPGIVMKLRRRKDDA